MLLKTVFPLKYKLSKGRKHVYFCLYYNPVANEAPGTQ